MPPSDPHLPVVGYVQTAPALGDPAKSRSRLLDRLAALEPRADLLVCPELATTGYCLGDRRQVAALAEPIPGPTTDALARHARERGRHVIVGLAERAGAGVFNSAALVGPEGVRQVYRKAHLFRREKALFDPGQTGFAVTRIAEIDLAVGILVCFDWAFPEAAGTLARRGADLIAHPSNLVLEHAFRAVPVRALENRVYFVTANRYGVEPGPDGPCRFRGGSFVATPGGAIARRAPAAEDAIGLVAVDPAAARDKRITPENDLVRDRRPQLYGER